FAAKLVASSSLESYLFQKDTNSYNKNELKLSRKRGSKNKKKANYVSKVIVDITFENGKTDRYIVQLFDISGYVDEAKKKSKVM
ncbi:1185_t:CDS:2, partial [Dentiscutata heterogama]